MSAVGYSGYMRPTDIVKKKRDGGELTATEIYTVVRAAAERSWPDYQLTAFLMAVCCRGMTPTETALLTRAMTESGRRTRAFVPEMWPSMAIGVIWLVVFAVALFGPDIVASSAGSFTRFPSAIIVALFAWLATLAVARHGFGRASSQSSQSTSVSDK